MEAVRVRWLGDYRTKTEILRAPTDEGGNEDDGEGNADLSPSHLLLASVASCMCLAVAHIARKRRVPISRISVDAVGEVDHSALRYKEVRLVVRSERPQSELDTLLEIAKRYCWVSNTLTTGCPVVMTAEPLTMLEADE
ncbi:MAG: OsmC family protein [Chloroflexota bacterium]|jgi:uncharacterized OsmC-like protein